MATIQIRDVPEESYEVLRRRARSEGRSIQSYMHQQVVELAREPTQAERVAAVEAALAEHGGTSASAQDIVRAVHEGRR